MKRDRKLIIEIVRYVRDNATSVSALDPPDVAGRDRVEVLYHVGLAYDAGFLDARVEFVPDAPRQFTIWGLTWKGHDEVEANCDC